MQFYDCHMTFDRESEGIITNNMNCSSKKNWGEAIIQDLNEYLLDAANFAISIYGAKIGEFRLLLGRDSLTRITAAELTKQLQKIFSDNNFHLENIKLKSLREILPSQAQKCLTTAERSDYFTYRSHWERGNLQQHRNFTLNYYNNEEFKIEETLFEEKKFTLTQAMNKAKKLMADKTLIEELERIYSDENPKKFFGHPVHYKFSAKNSQGAKQMADLICHALYENKRLVGRSITLITEVTEQCYCECDLDSIFDQSAGNTIIIELRGSKDEHKNYTTSYERVVKEFAELVRKYQQNTLFIFLEITENPGFTTKFIQNLQEDIYIVELNEGSGNRAEAAAYLKDIIKNGDIELKETNVENFLGNKVSFYPSDLHQIYHSILRDSLRNNTYTAYKQASRLMVMRNELTAKDAYQRLQDMIGLTEIKKIIMQIIDNAKIQKIRSSLGLEQQQTSLHMVFTGNPGSAKTSVARLLAEILSKEGILHTGEFIECGRADLVGEYVGHTAPKVKRQFKLAKGGVLFIDEAYSLIDDKAGLYGDEAINTIVQEMENNRNEVIVIFAGYPEKMKKFLERNEGLRSRIAFHVDFPNYNANELLQILQLMAKNKGFELNPEIENHCKEIFAKVCNKEDFGNGRFVRNLLEQALLKQSQRIVTENEGKEIGRDALLQLKVEDFAVNVVSQYTDNKKAIGFRK